MKKIKRYNLAVTKLSDIKETRELEFIPDKIKISTK